MVIQSIQMKDGQGIWRSHTCFFLTGQALVHLKHQDLSLVDAKAWSQAKASRREGFCHRRFKPNLVISSPPGEGTFVEPGQELGIGNARLFVLGKRHQCHQDCPMIDDREKHCRWTSTIRYARVAGEGTICVNDSVQRLAAQRLAAPIDP